MQTGKPGVFRGEGVSGGEFDEYHVNDQELYKLMIQHFYKEAE